VYIVKIPTLPFLGFVGLFGTVVASIQAFALEYRQIEKIFGRGSEEIMTTEEIYETYLDNPFDAPRSCKQETAIWLVIGYAFTTYLLNYCMARFLAKSESALLTLSLLTADLFAVIFSIVAEHYIPPTLFYIGLVLVLIGVIVYEMAPSPLGIAEDLVMSNEGIVIERGKVQEMKNTMNVEVSWNAADGPSGDQHDNDIERREIL
jgi:xanthosine utilization system XapX-like protein